jgi:anti-anti-sigma factor
MENRLPDVRVERPRAGAAVAVFTGEHDRTTSERVEALLDSLIDEHELVVADFSGAEFVDSSTLHTLAKSHTAAGERGSTFRLQLGTVPIVHTAFERSGMLELLDCAPTREQALRRGDAAES